MIEETALGFVAYRGADLYYRIFGDGKQTLLLLHGNDEDWTCFKEQIEELARHYRVIVMDSRGHGHSGRGDAPFTISQFARDSAFLLKKLHVSSVILLGFSDGGNVALEMAIRNEIPIAGLIVAGANLNPRGVKFFSQLPFIILAHKFAFLGRFFKVFRRKTEIFQLMTRQPNIAPANLHCVTCPALVLAGEHDLIRQSHTELIASSLGNSRMVIVKNASHFIFGKKYKAATNKILLDFLAQI